MNKEKLNDLVILMHEAKMLPLGSGDWGCSYQEQRSFNEGIDWAICIILGKHNIPAYVDGVKNYGKNGIISFNESFDEKSNLQ